MLRDRTPRVISELDRDSYRQLPDSGYMSLGFNRSLFPQTTLREDRPPAEITLIELPHLEDAILFRGQSKRVIDDLLAGTYQDVEVAEVDPTPLGNNPSTLVPPLMDGCHPVLYQVVATGRGASVVLEAKDFFVVGPDRSDLHCIILDQYAIEVLSGGRGYDKSLVSVKDFVWVYKVKPTPQALQSPTTTLQQASLPRTSALETTSIFFFRASHFAFVTPRDRREPIYGIILSLTVRHYKVAHARAAFEGCPEAVTLTPSVCHFNLNSLRQFEIVSGISRVNVPTAMRFSEPPVSLDARSQLAAIVRKFFPMHPEEGILPLTVSKIPASDRRWLADRLGAFDNFQRDPVGSKQKVAKIINATCSALAAVNSAGDDRQTHWCTASVITPVWFPLRLQTVLTDMASEAGWAAGRHATIWIPGTRNLMRVTVAHVTSNASRKTVTVHFQAFTWSHNSLSRAIDQYGRMAGDTRVVDVCIRLCKSTAHSNPVYDVVSRMQLFEGVPRDSPGDRIVALLYSSSAPTPVDLDALVPVVDEGRSFRVGNRSLTLTPDQRDAVRLGTSPLPIVAVQAAFGTGKTLVGALIAALSAGKPNSTIIVTTFRAHPALIELPNHLAYEGQLVSGTPAHARQMLLSVMNFPAKGIPFMFIDVMGESTRAASRFHSNTTEARICLHFIKQLISKGIRPADICVITFYREQYRQMRDHLDAIHVELTTVDSVQGREKEVVILLTTKTGFSPDSAEFIDDYRRLNVAVSRCRHGQFIFGHVDSLRAVPSWNCVLEWAGSINAIVRPADLNTYLRIY